MEGNQILGKILEKLETMDSRLSVLEENIVTIKEDIEIIKEDTTITRTSVNTLLDWAEEAQIEVRIPLYKKAE